MDNEALVAALEAKMAELKAKLDAAEKKALSDDLRARLAALLS